MLRLPFDNQKVKGNYAIFLKKFLFFFKKVVVFFEKFLIFFESMKISHM